MGSSKARAGRFESPSCAIFIRTSIRLFFHLLETSLPPGDNATLPVLPGAATSGGVSYGAGSRQTLTPEDGNELVRQCPAISDFAPQVRARAQLVYGRTNWNRQSVVGTTPNYLNVRDWTEMEEGDVFSDRDVANANKVCMVGTTIKRELFDNESPVGKELRISNVAFRVIGAMSSKSANIPALADAALAADYHDLRRRIGRRRHRLQFLSCLSPGEVAELAAGRQGVARRWTQAIVASRGEPGYIGTASS